MINTMEKFIEMMEKAEADTIADHGEELLEQGYFDIVQNVLMDATPEIESEVMRRYFGIGG